MDWTKNGNGNQAHVSNVLKFLYTVLFLHHCCVLMHTHSSHECNYSWLLTVNTTDSAHFLTTHSSNNFSFWSDWMNSFITQSRRKSDLLLTAICSGNDPLSTVIHDSFFFCWRITPQFPEKSPSSHSFGSENNHKWSKSVNYCRSKHFRSPKLMWKS